jgi:hypothetical protein
VLPLAGEIGSIGVATVTLSTLVRHDAERSSGPDFTGCLAQKLLEYSKDASGADNPEQVLDRLHAITSQHLDLNVFGAMRFPQKVMDWDALKLGETVFLKDRAMYELWNKWIAQTPHKLPVAIALAWTSTGPLTTTEMMQQLQPVGVDRWEFDLAIQYGARDGLWCPVGGRWLLCFWSAKPITASLSERIRVLLFAAASFAAIRLDQLGSGPINFGIHKT